MAAAIVDDFSIWLGNKLQALNTDEGVFGSYITGILDGDETLEEKMDALEGILSDFVENDISSVCKEIIDMWEKSRGESKKNAPLCSEDVDAKLVRLLESQSLTTTVQREYTAEERKIKDAILAQYSQMTDDEDENDDEAAGDTSENGLERNKNAFVVQQAEKLKREQAKLASQQKKDKDKEDREKQKQLKEEKKEKRKTQKGERRRM